MLNASHVTGAENNEVGWGGVAWLMSPYNRGLRERERESPGQHGKCSRYPRTLTLLFFSNFLFSSRPKTESYRGPGGATAWLCGEKIPHQFPNDRQLL